MRILVVCQHYWPEPFNVTEACEALVRRGHEVSVLTGLPNTGLPGNEIPFEYRGCARREETRNGVGIMRVGLHPRKYGALNRVLNYLSFWRNGNRLARRLDADYDVVLGYQFSPIMQVDPGITYARRHGKRMLLYCFDLWPASLSAGGFGEKSVAYRWMRRVSKRIYSAADRIAVTSPSFDDYFREELGLDVADSAYLPQFAESMFVEGALTEGGTADAADTAKSAEAPAARCAVERFDASKVNLTFAGNVGRAQSVETIVDAAALLRDEPDIVFHVVGSGSALDGCRRRARELGLGNVVFHGRKPIEVMPAYYAASDAMVVTLAADPLVSRTLPRKVQSYLAAGKPVLAAADGETARVLGAARCGLRCGPQDARGFAEACRRFAAFSEETRLEMGAAARMYYSENFTKERFVDDLERLLRETAGMEVAEEMGTAEKAGVAAVPEPVGAASASVEGAAGVAA